jgi:type IV secretory pathway TrbL component
MERELDEHKTRQARDHAGNRICHNRHRGTVGNAVENCRRASSSATEKRGNSTERNESSIQWKNASRDTGHEWAYEAFHKLVVASVFAAFIALQPVAATAAGPLDTLQNTIQSATVPWMDHSLQLATMLFSIMMTVTFITALMRYVSLNHTIEGFGHCFMDLFMKVIPLYVIMASATTFLPNIVNVANQLSGQLTGVPVNGPDEIFMTGWNLCGSIIHGADQLFPSNGVQMAGASIAGGLATGVALPGSTDLFLIIAGEGVALVASLVIIISFTLIAFEYFFAFAQAYITLSVGAISLGWISSSGTKHMGETYLSAAWVSVMRIVLTIACVSFVETIVPPMQSLSKTTDPNTMVMVMLQLCSTAIFAALLCWKVPAFATNMFSGRPAFSAAEVAGSVIRAARGK